MSNKSKILKVAITIVAVAVPFGLVSIGGYYAYKKYKENKESKKLEEENKLIEDKKEE